MPEMTEEQALSVLRQIRGLRDAFLGFNHVVDKIEPLVHLVSEARQVVSRLAQQKEALETEIDSLHKARDKAQAELKNEEARVAALKDKIRAILDWRG